MSATCENKCPHTPCACWRLDEKPEMTTDHDELLAPDDIERLEHSRTCMGCTGSTVADKLIKALRAVVELHYLAEGDWDENANARDLSHWCNACGLEYPCPTIQAIKDNLK